MQDQELAVKATALAARFREAGVIAEPGLGGSVVVTASDIEAEAMLANLETTGMARGTAVQGGDSDPLVRFSDELARGITDGHPPVHPDASANRYGYAPDESRVRQRQRGERVHAMAADRVRRAYGLNARTLLGPVLWHALVAREMLGLIAAQDRSVSDETVRSMADGAWDQLTEAEGSDVR